MHDQESVVHFTTMSEDSSYSADVCWTPPSSGSQTRMYAALGAAPCNVLLRASLSSVGVSTPIIPMADADRHRLYTHAKNVAGPCVIEEGRHRLLSRGIKQTTVWRKIRDRRRYTSTKSPAAAWQLLFYESDDRDV